MNKEKVIREIERLTNTQIIEVWNYFCENTGWDEDIICYWADSAIDDQFTGLSLTEMSKIILRAETHYDGDLPELFIGDRYHDRVVLFDEDYLLDVIEVSDLATDIIDDPEAYKHFDFLEDIFAEEE